MEPTIAEVIGWIVLLIVLIVIAVRGMMNSEPTSQMSDYWMDRNIHGKK